MDFLKNGVFWTAVVGLAGIAAAFFAPTWSQTRLQRRHEARSFRRAQRLVVAELHELAVNLGFLDAHPQAEFPPGPAFTTFLPTEAWESERAELAAGPVPDELWFKLTFVYTFIRNTQALGFIEDAKDISEEEAARLEAEAAAAREEAGGFAPWVAKLEEVRDELAALGSEGKPEWFEDDGEPNAAHR